jgi:hypothetical protein
LKRKNLITCFLDRALDYTKKRGIAVFKLMVVLAIFIGFTALGFIYLPFSLPLFQTVTDPNDYSSLASPVIIYSGSKANRIGDKGALARSQNKMSYLLSRTIPIVPALGWRMEGKDTGEPRFCYDHSLMTADNSGGVYMVARGVNYNGCCPEDTPSSILQYKADGTVRVALAYDKAGFEAIPISIDLDSKNTLYVPGIDRSRKKRSEALWMPVARIVDFPNNQKVEPYVGMTSEFAINLLEHCSEIPELCRGDKIDFGELLHLSVDAKDNLYLGFVWPRPTSFSDGYVQVTLLKIDPSKKVIRIGKFPLLSIDPQTNRGFSVYVRDSSYDRLMIPLNFSLAIDRFDNIFIHSHNVLLQFEKKGVGYEVVKVLRRMNDESSARSMASSPHGSLFALGSQEQVVWEILPNLNWLLLLGLPHQFGYQLGAGEQTRFKGAQEIVCDRQGRLFIFDNQNQVIIVYK